MILILSQEESEVLILNQEKVKVQILTQEEKDEMVKKVAQILSQEEKDEKVKRVQRTLNQEEEEEQILDCEEGCGDQGSQYQRLEHHQCFLVQKVALTEDAAHSGICRNRWDQYHAPIFHVELNKELGFEQSRDSS